TSSETVANGRIQSKFSLCVLTNRSAVRVAGGPSSGPLSSGHRTGGPSSGPRPPGAGLCPPRTPTLTLPRKEAGDQSPSFPPGEDAPEPVAPGAGRRGGDVE